MATQFMINKVYSFNTIAPGILGTSYENMKVIGMLNFKEASTYEDIISLHSKVRTTVPNVTLPISYEDCTYLLFQNENGMKKVLALEYIERASIVMKENKKLIITLNNYSLDDTTTISDMLKDAGYWDFSIRTES